MLKEKYLLNNKTKYQSPNSKEKWGKIRDKFNCKRYLYNKSKKGKFFCEVIHVDFNSKQVIYRELEPKRKAA